MPSGERGDSGYWEFAHLSRRQLARRLDTVSGVFDLSACAPQRPPLRELTFVEEQYQ